MAREIEGSRSQSEVRLPKRVTREGAIQRDWVMSRMRAARRVIITFRFAAGAAFTGLALRHSLNPAPAQAQTVESSTGGQPVQSQQVDVPSQSLFENQTSTNFSVAPAPRVGKSHVRTVSS